MRNLLIAGNGKLHKSVYCWSIAPGSKGSCRNSSLCEPTCYAMKAYRYHPSFSRAKESWDANYKLAQANWFISHMCEEIEKKKPKTIRIHVAGDFFNQTYVNDWNALAICYPDIKFYSFSKMFDVLNLSELNRQPNVNIINSILADGTINYGSSKEVLQKTNRGGLFNTHNKSELPYCKYGIDPNIECGKSCTRCHNKKTTRMIFLQH